MHILRNDTPLPFAYGETLQPGEWLLQDDHAFILAAQAPRGTVSVRPYLQPDAEDQKDVLIVRSGAIGDLLLATPAIRAYRQKHPQTDVWVCCLPRHMDILDEAHGCIEYPLPYHVADRFKRVISLENVIELSTEKGIHATDAFAEALGVTVTDYKPVYSLTDEEYRAVTELDSPFARTQLSWEKSVAKPRVAIHLKSSSAIRDYPLKKWFEVISTLVARGWEVMLLGNNMKVGNLPASVVDCSGKTFREAAAILSTCDVFAGVDSSFFNLCPALGVPAVGLFGPVDWRTRIKEGSGQFALHGQGCEPCHWTSPQRGLQSPPNKPCTKGGCCVLLDSIEPARIVAKIEKLPKR